MEKQELYKKMQAVYVEENDLRVGDKVKVLRHFAEDELGFGEAGSTCSKEKTALVGHVWPIHQIVNNWIRLDSKDETGWCFAAPFFVLEIVDQPRDPEVICKFFAKDAEGKLVEYEMSPDSARNYHEAAAKE